MFTRALPLVLLLGCPGSDPEDPKPGDTSDPSSTGTVSFSLEIDDTYAPLPEEGVRFQVTAAPADSLDAVDLVEVAPGEGGSFELEPGDYKIDAFYSWVDPDADLRGVIDTGGYYQSQCWGREEISLEAGDAQEVTIQVECDEVSLD